MREFNAWVKGHPQLTQVCTNVMCQTPPNVPFHLVFSHAALKCLVDAGYSASTGWCLHHPAYELSRTLNKLIQKKATSFGLCLVMPPACTLVDHGTFQSKSWLKKWWAVRREQQQGSHVRPKHQHTQSTQQQHHLFVHVHMKTGRSVATNTSPPHRLRVPSFTWHTPQSIQHAFPRKPCAVPARSNGIVAVIQTIRSATGPWI